MVSRINGHAVKESALAEAKAQAAITKRTLNTAEPTIVPVPTSLSDINTPEKEHKYIENKKDGRVVFNMPNRCGAYTSTHAMMT